MALEDIIQKERIISTPLAQDIADSPEEQERKFKLHVDTYVAIADIKSRWDAILNNLLKGKSATGLIYADTGYGKTSTGASLWDYAESKGIVAVPPFIWNSLADLLTATHGWVRYRLKHTHPEFIPDLEEKFRLVVAVGEESLAKKMSRAKSGSVEQAQKAIAFLKAEGRFRDELSPPELLAYLRFATEQVLEAGYDGLLILPDEFQLFKNNPDTGQNYDRLKQFIFGVHDEERLPIGCIVLTYNETFASIRESEYNYILARFAKPAGNLIDLENLYGNPGFVKNLWDNLADSCRLSSSEKTAIDGDVLDALEQFLRHSRARALMSGPRSVVETFRQAALHYTEKNCPYSLLDFCKDYLAGSITYSSQHTEAAQAHTRIMTSPHVDSPEKQKLVKLLCVHPEGVPPELFRKYDIPDSDREPFIDTLLPQHVTTKVTGPTLTCYRDDLLGVDSLNEIIKRLKPFNSKNRSVRQGAVRAFHKHVLPEIFTSRKQGTLLGWIGMQDPSKNLDGNYTMNLRGTLPTLREYPNRTLTVNIGTQEIVSTPTTPKTQLQVRFILDTTDNATNTFHVNANGLEFRFDMQKSINPQKIPEDIGKLRDLFSPESITPLLLLSILDFFDEEAIISIVKGAKQEVEVESLTRRIRTELIRYFFSSEVKESVVGLSTDLTSVSAGKDFVEGALKVLIPKQFPDYYAVATAKDWDNKLGTYRDALSKGHSLGVRRGIDPIKGDSKLFNMGQVAFDNFCAGIARDLLKVEPIPGRRDEQDIYFICHPFEELLVEQLQNSLETITIDAREVNSVKLPAIYQQAGKLGYLDEEIEELINILKVRGMADRKTEAGIHYLYLVETFINFAELEVKLKGLEENVALAKSNGFEYQCDNLSSAQTLAVTLGIENDEVLKDNLRQNLNSAEEHLKNKCAEWVRTERSSLKQKIYELETLRPEVPKILDQPTVPMTDFSQILFQSVQPQVKSMYTKISDEIRNIQGKVGETCDREIGTYESNRTPQNAIETATRLRQTRSRVDTDINRLNQKGTDAQELNRLFEHWRVLAQQVVGDRHLMVNSQEDSDVQNLVTRLDETQRRIRQHLADNRLSLKEVLSNHEHFKTQINEIKTEFDQFLGGKEREFLVYLASLEEQLIKVVDTPHVGVKWNPADSDGCYRETREKAVEKLKDVIKTALDQIDSLTRNLLKPIEIFAVPDSLRDRAIQLRQDVRKYADEFQAIRPKFITEDVDQQLQNWVSDLSSLRQKGEDIRKRWQAIERDLTEFGSKLSPKVQKLRETLTPLLDDGTFSSPREILECLEELYQANLVNLTVHRK